MPAGGHPPYRSAGSVPWAFSFCIFRTLSLTPPGPEGNKNPKVASSKQAMLGTMVSQLRKLRFPLTMRTTWGTGQRLRPRPRGHQARPPVPTQPGTWGLGAHVGSSLVVPSG